MRRSWEQRLKDALVEYERLRAIGSYLSALATLGGVAMVAPEQARQSVVTQLCQQIDPNAMSGAAKEIVSARNQAAHILGIGSKFNWDEFVLILTLRFEIELALPLMCQLGFDSAALDLGSLDAELREVANLGANRRSFLSAMAAVRKNWGVPLVDKWSPHKNRN
jgi:hypothetical protein